MDYLNSLVSQIDDETGDDEPSIYKPCYDVDEIKERAKAGYANPEDVLYLIELFDKYMWGQE